MVRFYAWVRTYSNMNKEALRHPGRTKNVGHGPTSIGGVPNQAQVSASSRSRARVLHPLMHFRVRESAQRPLKGSGDKTRRPVRMHSLV